MKLAHVIVEHATRRSAQSGQQYSNDRTLVTPIKIFADWLLCTSKMELFEEHFIHYPEFRVFACRQCRFCPVPQQLLTHLDAHHTHIPVLVQRQIVEYVRQLPNVT